VRVALDTDTLDRLNQERFSVRTELYYKSLPTPQFFTFAETVNIPSGANIALLPIEFTLAGIDMVDKWMTPLTIVDDPSFDYRANPRKHYQKALLRVFPFNDYSGVYSGTACRIFIKGDNVPIVVDEHTAYVVNENTVFFYAGFVDENRLDRKNYKIFVTFNDDRDKSLTVWSDNPEINLVVHGEPSWSIDEEMDAIRPYLKRIYVNVELEYDFRDYTTVPGFSIDYSVTGTLIMERLINIQIPDEDQAILW
jgi:hypothetical protein